MIRRGVGQKSIIGGVGDDEGCEGSGGLQAAWTYLSLENRKNWRSRGSFRKVEDTLRTNDS